MSYFVCEERICVATAWPCIRVHAQISHQVRAASEDSAAEIRGGVRLCEAIW